MVSSFVRTMPGSLARLLATCTLVAACTGGTEPDDDATFTGRLNGRDWRGEASAWLPAAGGAAPATLWLWGSRPVGHAGWPDESIAIRIPATGPGVYELAPDDVSLTVLTGGDVIAASYGGTNEVSGTVAITRLEAADGIIEGEVAFAVRTAGEYAPHGRLALFTRGRFRATIASDL